MGTQYPHFVNVIGDLQVLQQDYRKYKRQHHLMDYDDLLRNTLHLFREHKDIGRQVAAMCRYVLVDEYQDTNRLQATLVECFASGHGNVMVVGDDAQSIYRFRGAEYDNVFTFQDRFPGTTILKLEHNYRSTRPILDLANHIITRSHKKFDKKLFTREKDAGELPVLILSQTSKEEAQFVVQQIMELREGGMSLDRMGVLFRNGHNSFGLEFELNQRNIPFSKRGGVKFSEAAHVKDVVAHIRVLENPQDGWAWLRILLLLRGVGRQMADRIVAQVMQNLNDPYMIRDLSSRYEDVPRLFRTLREASDPDRPLAEQVHLLLQHYEPLCRRKYHGDFTQRWQDIEHLAALINTYASRREFLARIALDPVEEVPREGKPLEEEETPLVLSTIHSAKGLEFSVVFIIQALDGILPSRYAEGDTEQLDEELRLLYVAITRAEDDLFISYPLTHSPWDPYLAKGSRFLSDIPPDLLEEHVLRPAAVSEKDVPRSAIQSPAIEATKERVNGG